MGSIKTIFFFILSSLCINVLNAQEHIAPLGFNGAVIKDQQKRSAVQNKTTANTLPFFEDFTGYDTWPDATKWLDGKVYINNTMGISVVSRGVATFDGLDANGLPYNQSISTALVYADSLTSQPITMASNTPADSIYFSFYFQPQGNGFAPEVPDSLMLYFKKSNEAWIKVWSKEGSLLDTFRQVLIPIRDTSYMHAGFQFRFVNKASLFTNDDVWNVDYIKIATGRNMYDTLINDVAMTVTPSSLLNDLSAMPYRQFMANPNKERASQITATIRNGYGNPQTVTYGYKAREHFTNAPLSASATSNITVVSNDNVGVSLPSYNNTVTSTNRYNNFTFDTRYYVESLGPTDDPVNDTILHQQVFYNYMAYDDGSAEKSYYLNLFPTLPGKTALEFHLNEPDTITGVSIYFGRQVPLAYSKYFSVAVYNEISMTGGPDKVAYQEDLLIPAYLRNDFYWTYKFERPVPMPAGTFYIGTIQPALSNSDSLYLGLDVNRATANHLYYNVVGYWQPSGISGALMVRPMMGPVIASDVPDVAKQEVKWFAGPNPVQDRLKIQYDDDRDAHYEIMDMQGRRILYGAIRDGECLDVNDMTPGVYLMRLNIDKAYTTPQKIIKY